MIIMWDKNVLTWLWLIFHGKYLYQIITLYTLNLHNIICQFHLNKAGRKRKMDRKNLYRCAVSILNILTKGYPRKTEKREGASHTVICGTNNFPGRHKINGKAECGLEVLGCSFKKLHTLSSADTVGPGTGLRQLYLESFRSSKMLSVSVAIEPIWRAASWGQSVRGPLERLLSLARSLAVIWVRWAVTVRFWAEEWSKI